jgi:hypothetical protein
VLSSGRGREKVESMSDPHDSTSTGNGASLSSTFLEFCGKVRNNNPSILPEDGKPFTIRPLSENEDVELADALLENTSVTFLELKTENYTKRSAEAMAKFVRTSKRLQRIHWQKYAMTREKMLCLFLPAIQESTSLKELHMRLPPCMIGGTSNLAFESMLTHTQSLRSLSLTCPSGLQEDIAVATVLSGLKKNTTLRELTLYCMQGATIVPPHVDQSLRPSSPSKAMFAWECGESDWTRDCVAKRRLQDHGIGNQ